MQQYTSINSVKYILQDLSMQLGFDTHRLIDIQTHHKASIFSIKLRPFSSQKFCSVQDLAAAEQQRKQSARSNRQQPQSQCQRDVKEMSKGSMKFHIFNAFLKADRGLEFEGGAVVKQ